MSAIIIPAGMRAVTRAEFLAAMAPVGARPRQTRAHADWEIPERRVVGRSWPGFKCTGPTGYALMLGINIHD